MKRVLSLLHFLWSILSVLDVSRQWLFSVSKYNLGKALPIKTLLCTTMISRQNRLACIPCGLESRLNYRKESPILRLDGLILWMDGLDILMLLDGMDGLQKKTCRMDWIGCYSILEGFDELIKACGRTG